MPMQTVKYVFEVKNTMWICSCILKCSSLLASYSIDFAYLIKMSASIHFTSLKVSTFGHRIFISRKANERTPTIVSRAQTKLPLFTHPHWNGSAHDDVHFHLRSNNFDILLVFVVCATSIMENGIRNITNNRNWIKGL